MLELSARDLSRVLLAIRQQHIEFRLIGLGERDLCLDHGLAHGLHQLAARLGDGQIGVARNVVQSDRNQQIVDVVAAQVRVAAGRDHLEDALMQLQNGDIECSAAKVSIP